jgi:hypothetical protein
MKVTGTIKLINAEQVISEKFRKREFVITTEDKYPQDILFQLTQNNTDLIDTIRVGEKVEVSYNLRGKEYNGRYYVSLECWQVSIQQGTPVAKPMTATQIVNEVEDNGDLPF